MAAASDYFENQLLTWGLTSNTATRPTARYLALYTTAPTDAGGGTEVSGGAYARQLVSFTVSASTASNTSQIMFPMATSQWGTVVAIGVFDSITGGNLLYYGNAAVSKLIDTGDTMVINAGNLIITLD